MQDYFDNNFGARAKRGAGLRPNTPGHVSDSFDGGMRGAPNRQVPVRSSNDDIFTEIDCLIERKRLTEAERLSRDVLANTSIRMTLMLRGRCSANSVHAYFMEYDWKRARALAEECLAANPNDDDFRNLLVATYC